MRGSSALAGEDPLGHCVFERGVEGGVAIYEAFSYCKMMCEEHFLMWKNGLLCLSNGTPLMTWWWHVANK